MVEDIDKLIATARMLPDLRAIMIDPIVVVVKGNGHNNAEVRRDMAKLYEFEVVARDPGGEIMRGRHQRAIIDESRLLEGAAKRR